MCKSTLKIDSARCGTAYSRLTLGLALASVLGTSGCRTTSDNQIDLLERELRVQEDYIYELEGYLVDYSDKLRDCRGCSPSQMAAYSEEIHSPAPSYQSQTQPKRPQPKRHRAEKDRSILEDDNNDLPMPEKEDSAPEVSPEDLEVPEIDMNLDDPVTDYSNEDELQQLTAIQLDYESADGEAMIIPDPVDFEESLDNLASPELEEFEDESIEQTVAIVERVAKQLKVAQLFRGSGDEQSSPNLLTVVEALDSNDEPVDLDGEVSLMIMTPGENGKLKRLKRWNFTPEETVAAWQSSELGDGLHLELPLESTELPENELQLWVRLVSADNTKLLTKLPFHTKSLVAMGDQSVPTIETKIEVAEALPATSSENPLRSAAPPAGPSSQQKIRLAQSNKSKASSSGWRRAMHRTGGASTSFATTSSLANGWTKQSPTQLQYKSSETAVLRSSTLERP